MKSKKQTLQFCISVAALVVAVSAFAQQPAPPPSGSISASDSGLSFGLRSGYAVPLGNVSGSTAGRGAPKLSDTINGMIPIWADVGYRFASNWYVGGFYQYGIGLLPSNVTGSEWNMRFGINVHYHFMPGEMLDPWVGLGAAYEILNYSPSGGGPSSQLKGFEFGNAQVGLDFAVAPQFAVGPFVAFSVAQYSDVSQGSVSGSITNKDIHEWLFFGVRGVFNLNL